MSHAQPGESSKKQHDRDAAPLGLEAPAGNRRFPRIDALRAVAALSVLAYHWRNDHSSINGVFGKLVGHGNVGVSLFFLISGFLLYRPYVTGRTDRAPTPTTRGFYERRLLRIVPAYWVALTVIAIYPGLPLFGSDWWRMYFFAQIYDPHTVFTIGIGAAWSLCIEVTFYALLPVYAYSVRRVLKNSRSWRAVLAEIGVLIILALASVGFHQWIHDQGADATLAFTLPGTFYLFAEGMAIAILSVQLEGTLIERKLARARLAFIAFAVAVYVLAALSISAKALGSVNPVWGIVALLALIGLVLPDKTPRTGRVLRFMNWLGVVSYGIYLWHQVVLGQTVKHMGPAASLIVTLIISICLGAASYYIVERPSLKRKRRLAEARQVR
jgi:peptidoglycan/LPS O-acetylase OafA/YrhL